MKTLSAVPIRTPYIDEILNGEKTEEYRTKNTKKRGMIALIQAGSGLVVGTAVISGVHEEFDYYAWELTDVVKFKNPVPYKHPSGAVTWVTLRDETVDLVLAENERSK